MMRLQFDMQFEKRYVIGADEVGRGCLAGPICAAAVALDTTNTDLLQELEQINDSKKLSKLKRERLLPQILSNCSSWSLVSFSHESIDKFGIEYCNNTALWQALRSCGEHLPEQNRQYLVDGLGRGMPAEVKAVTKGDQQSAAIACASIIAKVSRDRLMQKFDHSYPGWDFSSHVGYPTPKHKQAITSLGVSRWQRRSFSY